jgi:hypothetical protein
LAGCKVEQYAIRTRAIRYSGRGSLYVDGEELGPVPRFAICRAKDGINLFPCDGRWKVLGCSGAWASVKEAKGHAERMYPGLSKVWVKTGFTNEQVRKHLDEIGYNLKCSFCGKLWYEVQRIIITRKNNDVGICDRCARDVIALMNDSGHERLLPDPRLHSTAAARRPERSRRSVSGRRE